MVLQIRTSTSALLKSKASALAVFFVAITSGLGAVFALAYSTASGATRTLFLIALLLPVIGIGLSILSFITTWLRARRPVLIIDDTVSIPEADLTFPVEELEEIKIFGKGRRSYVTIIPPGTTVAFPLGSSPTPSHFAELVALECPYVTVTWLGSI